MSGFLDLFGPTTAIFDFLFRFWWIWGAPVSVALFLMVLLAYRQTLYKRSTQWVVLELRMPREIEKSPKAMEQVFAALHPLRNSPNDVVDKYSMGEVTLWWSLEIVSFEGEIHFFMWVPEKNKRIIIANLYGNYPMIEIEEASDYFERFPDSFTGLYEAGYDLWGGEVVLTKDDAYPIRTYLQYENMEESMAIDPIAGLLETLTRVTRGEHLFFQIVVRPADDSWKKRGDELVKKLKEEGSKRITGPLGEYEDRPIRTPGETEILKTIELSLSKPGYETLIRYALVKRKEEMNGIAKDFGRRSIMTALNQYMAQNMNSFMRNPKTTTDVRWTYFPWVLNAQRLEGRKARIWHGLRTRAIPDQMALHKFFNWHLFSSNFKQRTIILSTEELATLYHPPTHIVLTGPILKRVEAKKMGPSSGLPIFEEEKK